MYSNMQIFEKNYLNKFNRNLSKKDSDYALYSTI